MTESFPSHEHSIEKITLAALSYKGTIYTGGNHGEAFLKLIEEHPEFTPDDMEDLAEECDGFITSTGRFISRVEARALAEQNGQKISDPIADEGDIFSENIEGLSPYNKKP